MKSTLDDLSLSPASLSAPVAAAAIGGGVGGAEGGALAAILTLLVNIPAGKKVNKHIESELSKIHKILYKQRVELEKINESQYKIIKESLNSIIRTEESEKLEHLRNIICNTVSYNDFCKYDSILLSRIIRDISAEEVTFLLESNSYKSIAVYSWYEESKQEETENLKKKMIEENCLLIYPDSVEELIVSGLVSLGILVAAEVSLGLHRYKFSKTTMKLTYLLKTT